MEEELGDLLFQIVFHTTLATEAGAFGLAEVARGIHSKLVHRHPHVFGQVQVDGSADVVANWEQIKKAEKGRESVFDGIPAHLPALLFATKVVKKAGTVGVDLPTEVATPTRASAAAVADPDEATVGALLLAAVGLARSADVDPEAALRTAASTLRDRAMALEAG